MISIVIIAVSFATELFYLTLIHSFVGCYFDYLLLYPLQVCGVSLTRSKEFKAFWESYFTSPPVKVADNFWKVWGLVDGFNKTHKQISSGVGNASYD